MKIQKNFVSRFRVSTERLTKDFLSRENPECNWQLTRKLTEFVGSSHKS